MSYETITFQNVRRYFPAASAENPLVGEPFWIIQAVGYTAAMQILRVVPDGPVQQQVLQELRATINLALTAVPALPPEQVERRLRQTLAPYTPTPIDVVDAMLSLAEVGPTDMLYDLGSGDGRVCLRAATEYGCRAAGIEVDPLLVGIAEAAIPVAVRDLVWFCRGDILGVDLSPATVVTCYLTSNGMAAITPMLTTLRSGARIVSHGFELPGWQPEAVIDGIDRDKHEYQLFLYRIA